MPSLEKIFADIPTQQGYMARNISNASYGKAMSYVPIISGFLASTIYTTTGEVVTLGATAPYAYEVEHGIPATVAEGDYIATVKRHRRKTKAGRVLVKAHKKVYKGGKPIMYGGRWVTQKTTEGRPGQFFLKRALEEAITDSIEDYLSSLGATRV